MTNDKPLLLKSRFGGDFAESVFRYLDGKYNGIFEMREIDVTFFPNKEHYIKGKNVRGRRVYVFHSFEGYGELGSPHGNYDPSVGSMGIFLINDALLRASAGAITDVLPHYPWQRQDKKEEGRVPIAAKVFAKLLEISGGKALERVVTVDLHSGQQQGYFEVPVDNLFTNPVFADYLSELEHEFVVVAPDGGAGNRARDLARRLRTDVVYSEKIHHGSEKVSVQIKGEVGGRIPVIIDDMADSGETLQLAAEALRKGGEYGGGGLGASEVYACATHALLSPKDGLSAEDRLRDLVKLVVTDTVPMSDGYKQVQNDWLTVLSISPLIGEAIYQIEQHGSVSSLLKNDED